MYPIFPIRDTIRPPKTPGGRTFDVGRLRLPALALLSFVYVFGIIWSFKTIRFGINDNTGVLEYAQLGLPSAAMGIPLVKLLHLGYSLLPVLPWYGLSYYLFNVLSVCVWLWSFSRVFRPWWLAAIFSLAFLGYYTPFVLYLDYTNTAMMLCAASLAWILLEVMEERPGYRQFLAPGLMFTLGAMARPEVPLGSLAYAFSLALLVAFWRLRARPFVKELPRLAVIAAVFFAPMVMNLAGDAVYRHYFESPQQQQYDRFDTAREALEKRTTGQMKMKMLKDDTLLASLGLTYIEADHIFHWNYLDERVDTVQVLQALLDKAPPREVSLGDFVNSMTDWFQINYLTLPLLGAALIALVIVWRRPWLGLLALSTPLYCILFSIFMTLFFFFQDRTQSPLVMGCGFMTLLICYRVAVADRREPGRILLAAAFIGGLLACWGGYPVLTREAVTRRIAINAWTRDAQERLDILNRDYAGQVILMDPHGALPLYELNPLRNHPVDFQPIDLGWSTFSPLFYQQIGKLGIQHGYELMDALITHHAYALGGSDWCQGLLDHVSPPLKQHLKVTVVRQFDDNYNLYQFSEGPAHK